MKRLKIECLSPSLRQSLSGRHRFWALDILLCNRSRVQRLDFIPMRSCLKRKSFLYHYILHFMLLAEMRYLQVGYMFTDQEVHDREFGNLLEIKDRFTKITVSMDEPAGGESKGIRHLNIRDFLVSVS